MRASHQGTGLSTQVESLKLDNRTLSEHTSHRSSLSPYDTRTTAFKKRIIARHQNEIAYQLKNCCICVVCGGKALYYMHSKRYCKAHVHIGIEAQRRKWG